MPCYDARDNLTAATMKAELDKVTRLLCELCRAIADPDELIWADDGNRQYVLTPETLAWWKEHKAADDIRLGYDD